MVKSSFSNIDGPVTYYAIWHRMLKYFLNDVEIQQFYNSKTVLENIIHYVLKILKRGYIWEHVVLFCMVIYEFRRWVEAEHLFKILSSEYVPISPQWDQCHLWYSIRAQRFPTGYASKLYQVQSAKILLLPPKYEIIMVPSNHSFFQYCYRNIRLFSIAPCKVITLNPLCILSGISSLLLFDGFLSKVIGLPTIAIAIDFALSRS